MRRNMLFVCGLVVLGLVFPVQGVDKPATDKKPPAPKEKVENPKDKLVASGSVMGTLTAVEGSSKNFTVQVKYKVPVLDQNQYNSYVSWQQELLKAPTIANPTDRANHIQKCQNYLTYHQARLYSAQEKTENIELVAGEEMKVRVANPPVAFDDNGKAKKYTTKELKELRGNFDYGYPGEFDNLKVGQPVKVYVVKKAAAKPGKKPEPEIGATNRLTAVRIDLGAEPKK